MALKVDSSNDEEHERSGNDWYNRTRNRPTRVAAAAARRVVGVLVVVVVVAGVDGFFFFIFFLADSSVVRSSLSETISAELDDVFSSAG